jgi:hypothetical protein
MMDRDGRVCETKLVAKARAADRKVVSGLAAEPRGLAQALEAGVRA